MTEQTDGKTEGNVENLETEGTENETVTEQAKTEKVFKADEVNRIVQTRLKKVKSDFEAEIQSRDEQLEKYEDILKKQIEAQSKDLPENIRKLLFKLSIFEQLEFLADESNKVSKKTIPATPKQEEGDEKPKRKSLGTLF